MTEYCFNKNNTTLCDFSILCSYILSHPLYFSYLIFFSPYLFKLLSFLSPLFFTTFLLLLSLFTTLIPLNSILNSKDGFFLRVYTTLLENLDSLRPSFDEEEEENIQPIEEFEVYKVVFDIPPIELSVENPIELTTLEEVHQGQEETVKQREEETRGTNPKKVEEEVKKQENFLKRSESELNESQKTPNFGSLRINSDKKLTDPYSPTSSEKNHLGSFGSMRKEKEWRRTLACKLFEERHNWSNNKINVNNNGGEDEDYMDLLWEDCETEQIKVRPKDVENNKKGRKRDNHKIEDLVLKELDDEVDSLDSYDDNGKICCLQALKLSAGKMNLSMGRPNLVKFSKAFKGIGWLQSHVKRSGKKGYK